MVAICFSKFDAHGTKTANADNSDSHLSSRFGGSPMSQRIEEGGASAKDGTDNAEVHGIRNDENKMFVEGVRSGISAESSFIRITRNVAISFFVVVSMYRLSIHAVLFL